MELRYLMLISMLFLHLICGNVVVIALNIKGGGGGGTHGLMAIFEMAVIVKIFTRVMTNYISVESL